MCRDLLPPANAVAATRLRHGYTTKVLSDRDLADIYAFLESLPKPAPVSSIPLLAP